MLPVDRPISSAAELVSEVEGFFHLKPLLVGLSLDTNEFHLALAILRRYPNLASYRYKADEGFPLYTPLCMYIAVGACLKVIREVYELYPHAISVDQGPESCPPLHVACQCNNPYEVVQFILDKHPDSISIQKGRAHALPIHFCLPYHASAEDTIKMLVDRYPECVNVNSLHRYIPGRRMLHRRGLRIPLHRWETPIHQALRLHCRQELIEYLINACPLNVDTFAIGDMQLELDQAKEISKLLPQIKNLIWLSTEWPADTILYLMEAIKCHKSIKTLTLGLSKSSLTSCNDEERRTFSNLFKETNSLEEFCLRGTQDSVTAYDWILQTMTKGLKHSQSLHTFKMDWLCFKSRSVHDFVTTGSAPETVVLNHVTLEDSYPEIHQTKPTECKNCRVETLEFDSCIMSRECFSGWISGTIPQLQSLKTLRLYFAPEKVPSNACDSVVELVVTGQMETLHISGIRLTIEPFFKALGVNNTIKRLWLYGQEYCDKDYETLVDVLKTSNTTLEGISGGIITNDKVWHYLEMNELGRGKAGNPETTTRELTDLLCAVPEKLRVGRFPRVSELDAYFWFLRLTPTIWCNDALSHDSRSLPKKRKPDTKA